MTARLRFARAAHAFTSVFRLTGAWPLLSALLVLCGGYCPAFAEPLANALDQPALNLISSGDALWFAQTNITHDGSDAVQSGHIGDNQSSSLSTTISGKATVSFRWKISSEENYDFLRFFIDGEEQAGSISGEVDWQSQTYEITGNGAHTLRWSYTKDTGVVAGADTAWLDELMVRRDLPTASPAITLLASGNVFFGERARLGVQATGGALTFQWYQGASGDTSHPVAGAIEPEFHTLPVTASVSFWVRVTNSLGATDSQTANINLIPRTGHELKGMGNTSSGQLGIGAGLGSPSVVTSLTDIAQVATAYSHSLLLKTDGTLWAMGSNEYGQVGSIYYSPGTIPVQIAADVAHVAAGASHTLFIKTDGTLWSMGYGSQGQLGDGYHYARSTPVQIASDVAHAAAGANHSLFVKTDGSLWAMGYNAYGQLGGSSPSSQTYPIQVATDVVQVSAGANHSLFVKTDGSLWAMGDNGYGQLGDGSYLSQATPVQVGSDVIQVSAGGDHSLYVKTDGSLWAMGHNGYGQLGDGSSQDRGTPVQVASEVMQTAAGSQHSLFVKIDGSLWAMGENSHGQLGDGSFLSRLTPVQVSSHVAQVSAGDSQTLFVKTDGTLWAMGYNSYGQLGDISPIRTTPVSVSPEVVQVAAGGSHSLFIKADGTLWAMGHNEYGQLGDGSTTSRATPVQVATDVAQVATGSYHTLFIKTDGTLWATGYNSYGQLGDGTEVHRSDPVQIASNVIQVSAGGSHSLFIKADGSLWSMGYNNFGQLGIGFYDHVPTPVQIASDVIQVAAGGSHSLFVKTDGTLWATGYNSYGQLGHTGSYYHVFTPVQITTEVSQVVAGTNHSLFIKTDGSLWAMGYNGSGQLGDGGYYNRYIPVQVASDVAGVAAGGAHSLFIATDTSLWSMGKNNAGQLGDGVSGNEYTNRAYPLQIATGVVSAVAGGEHSLFIQAPVHTVTFELGSYGVSDGGGALVQTVIEGRAAIAPIVSVLSPEWVFQGWDTAFDNITGDLTVQARYLRLQSITFSAPPGQRFDPVGANTLLLSATTSSGLPVIFEVVSGPASLAGDNRTLTLSDAGIVVVRATQPGDDTWAAAAPIQHRFIVKGVGEAQKITFPQPAPRHYGDGPFSLEAASSADLPVIFEIVSGPAALQDEILTITGVGRVVIKAGQPGGNGFGAAPDVIRTLIVKKAPLTVTVDDAARFVGEHNREFTLGYSGFVGADALDEAAAIAALDQPPVARCKANPRSPQGDYPITLSGGSDDLYEFVFVNPAGTLVVFGFAGTYEALLLDLNDGSPVGKLTLTIPANGLSYTGVLSLAREPRPLVVSSTSRIEGTTPFVASEDFSSASAVWNHAVTGFDSLSLTVRDDGSLTGVLDRNALSFATLAYGRRLHVPVAGTDSPWSGRHTLVLRPGYPSSSEERPFPLGFGHASCSIAARTGLMALSGKLPDGRLLTASLKPGDTGAYLLWTNPYGQRTHSFLAGMLADDSLDFASATTDVTGVTIGSSFDVAVTETVLVVGASNPADSPPVVVGAGDSSSTESQTAVLQTRESTPTNRERHVRRDYISSNSRFLFWKKAALPETTPTAKRDKSYRAGFGPLILQVSLDPWLPPLKKATADEPVTTLPQRLGIAGTNVASGQIAVGHGPSELLGESASALPGSATLSAAGKLLVGTPNDTQWKVDTLNPATGAFSGSFILKDSTPTDANPGKITKRTVPFSGTFYQRPEDDSLLGVGFFLLPALPGSESNEQLSGELRFSIP